MMILRKFLLFLPLKHNVTTHLNRLIEAVQMRGHNISLRGEQNKIKTNLTIIILTPVLFMSSVLLDWCLHTSTFLHKFEPHIKFGFPRQKEIH